MQREAMMEDDIAAIRCTSDIHHQVDAEDGPYGNGEFKLRYAYMTTEKTAHDCQTDSTQAYLSSAANALGINVLQDKEEYEKSKAY